MKPLPLLALLAPMLIRAACAAELGDQIDRLAQPYVDSETVVGMTVGVVKGDQRLVRGYGQLSAGDPRAPDGRTIYELGSVSKVFTGLLLADAVIAKRVTLDTPAEDLLPSGVTIELSGRSLPVDGDRAPDTGAPDDERATRILAGRP